MGSPFFIKYVKKISALVTPFCYLCPRECKINRDKYPGVCKTKNQLEIASYNLHFGEEPPISGTKGSGTIFFAGCNLSCVYCQNYPISQLKNAYKRISIKELADIMLNLQKKGAHNINLVTPSHFIHLICESIEKAKIKGLNIPIVYNTSSYDKEEVIYLLKDYVDIYLADLKYADNRLAKKLSGINDYFDVATKAILAMYRTKGSLTYKNHIATKGVIIRHLILPNHFDNTKNVIKWIVSNLPNVTLSLMSQYFPAYKAFHFKDINSKLQYNEYEDILSFIHKYDINGFIQDYCNQD